jgi:hypothetical protein
VSARGPARQRPVSPFESRVGSETAPAQFREPRRPRRRPEPAGPRGPRATSDPRPPRSPRPPRRLTISERPSRQAFWKRVWRSSWGRSLKPVYLICKAERPAEIRRAIRGSARPPAPIRASRDCGQTACPGEIAPRRVRPRGVPGYRAGQTFLRAGPLGARRGLRAARPAASPHLTLAAQLPEELLVLELASLVGHNARHLPALRPRRPGSALARAPANRLCAADWPPTRGARTPASLCFRRPPAWAPAPGSLEVKPPALAQPTPPPAAAASAVAYRPRRPSTRRPRPPPPPLPLAAHLAQPPAPPPPAPPLRLARPPASNSSKQDVPFTTPRPAPRMRDPPACGAAGLQGTQLLPQRSHLPLACP